MHHGKLPDFHGCTAVMHKNILVRRKYTLNYTDVIMHRISYLLSNGSGEKKTFFVLRLVQLCGSLRFFQIKIEGKNGKKKLEIMSIDTYWKRFNLHIEIRKIILGGENNKAHSWWCRRPGRDAWGILGEISGLKDINFEVRKIQ